MKLKLDQITLPNKNSEKLQQLSRVIEVLLELNPSIVPKTIAELLEADSDLQDLIETHNIEFTISTSPSIFHDKIQKVLEKIYTEENKKCTKPKDIELYFAENYDISSELLSTILYIFKIYLTASDKLKFIDRVSKLKKSKTIKLRKVLQANNLPETYEHIYSIFQSIEETKKLELDKEEEIPAKEEINPSQFLENMRKLASISGVSPVQIFMNPVNQFQNYKFGEETLQSIATKLGYSRATSLKTSVKVIEKVYEIDLEEEIIEFLMQLKQYLKENGVKNAQDFESHEFSKNKSFPISINSISYLFPELRLIDKTNLSEKVFNLLELFDPVTHILFVTDNERIQRLQEHLSNNFKSSDEIRALNLTEFNKQKIREQGLPLYLKELGILYNTYVTRYQGDLYIALEFLANLYDGEEISREEAVQKAIIIPYTKALKEILKDKYSNPVRSENIDLTFFKTLKINHIAFRDFVGYFPKDDKINLHNITIPKRTSKIAIAKFLQSILFG